MKLLLAKLAHEPVAFWTGLATVIQVVLVSTGNLPTLAGTIAAVVTALGGAAARTQVSPTISEPDPPMGD